VRRLTADEEARARRLHANVFVFTGRTDVIAGVSEGRSCGERAVASQFEVPLLRAGGVKAVCEHVAGDSPYFSTLALRNVRPLRPTKFALQIPSPRAATPRGGWSPRGCHRHPRDHGRERAAIVRGRAARRARAAGRPFWPPGTRLRGTIWR